MNIEKIKDHIKYLREDKYNTEFYVALLAYDIFEFDEKEITEEMNFPNQSFLGKYFKEHVGISPSAYRKGK